MLRSLDSLESDVVRLISKFILKLVRGVRKRQHRISKDTDEYIRRKNKEEAEVLGIEAPDSPDHDEQDEGDASDGSEDATVPADVVLSSNPVSPDVDAASGDLDGRIHRFGRWFVPLKPTPAVTSEKQMSLTDDHATPVHMQTPRLPNAETEQEDGSYSMDHVSAPSQVPAGSAVTGPSGGSLAVPRGDVGVGPPTLSSSSMVGGREKKAPDTRKCVRFTPDETATLMRLVQEQEGDRNWVEIAANLNQANKAGALNPELHQGGRTRSTGVVRQRVAHLLKQQQYPEEGQPQRERDEVQRDHKRARSPISSPFADITNKVRMGTRKRKPTTKVEENC